MLDGNTLITIFLTALFIGAILYTVGSRASRREDELAAAVAATPVGDLTMVMITVTAKDGHTIDELPLYFAGVTKEGIAQQMGEWLTRVYVTGYSQDRPQCGDTKAWPPSMLGNIYWEVKSWGKAAEAAEDTDA